MSSSHDYKKDKRNNKIKILINNKFFLRKDAKISVFDSGFILGDGCWTGIRLHNNKLLFLKEHLKRLFDDAKTLGIKIPFSKKGIGNMLYKTVKENKMNTDVHIRLVVSRGIKSTPYQDPSFTISPPTIVIIPEYKKPDESIYKKGLILKTVKIIRGPHNVQDPRINSLSKLNCILACIEAKKKKADEALMLDINGNIATNNSTHFFYIKNKIVYTSKGKYCVKGITRDNIIKICKENNIKIVLKNFKLKEVMSADEAFATGTFANIIPIKQINSKKFKINNKNLSLRLRELFLLKINKLAPFK
jgi:branched-chain amino acid aminotransferase